MLIKEQRIARTLVGRSDPARLTPDEERAAFGRLADTEMVLAKADLGIAERYAELAGEQGVSISDAIHAEFERTVALVCRLRESDELLEREPAL